MKAIQLATVDVSYILADLVRYYELFNDEVWRQEAEGSPHKDTKSIYLRSVVGELTADKVFNQIHCETTPQMYLFQSVADIVLEVMDEADAVELGRVMLISLKPGGSINTHADEGDYPEYYERYHIPIVSEAYKAPFTIEDEVFHMHGGQVWLINNNLEHSVVNNSDKERIHLVIDMKGLH